MNNIVDNVYLGFIGDTDLLNSSNINDIKEYFRRFIIEVSIENNIDIGRAVKIVRSQSNRTYWGYIDSVFTEINMS